MNRIAAAVAGLLLACAGTSETFAATYNVPADYATIQAAIDVASDGDTILVAPGTYTSPANVNGVIQTNGKAISIMATGAVDQTFINARGNGSGVRCLSGEGPDTMIQGFTIIGCYQSGIRCVDSSPTVINCIILNNTAGEGGAVYCRNGSPTFNGCTINSNNALSGGAFWCQDSSNITLDNCTITNNSANLGGAFYCVNSSIATITNCTISANTASNKGGGFFCLKSSGPVLQNCEMKLNTSSDAGGAFYCFNSSTTILTDCTISNNIAESAGGLFGPATLLNSTISFNTAYDGRGGGISCTKGQLTITNCTISNNTASDSGGGIYSLSNTPTITDSIICSNRSDQISGTWTDNGGNTVSMLCVGVGGACCTENQTTCITAVEDDCDVFGGIYMGDGTQCEDVSCPTICIGDANGDHVVDVDDILATIDHFGATCP
ncbi:MAG: right-handed parallel beta-helix repeat-containing protein [Phycisphaerales bacterium]|nr:right-handed parallel beta-helix repeat-containing protein [Phycisphaerales bacterium]MCH2154330.1 right-handed parallel beta-helix repeat-containing protein [Phycisphaerales bacterium]